MRQENKWTMHLDSLLSAISCIGFHFVDWNSSIHKRSLNSVYCAISIITWPMYSPIHIDVFLIDPIDAHLFHNLGNSFHKHSRGTELVCKSILSLVPYLIINLTEAWFTFSHPYKVRCELFCVIQLHMSVKCHDRLDLVAGNLRYSTFFNQYLVPYVSCTYITSGMVIVFYHSQFPSASLLVLSHKIELNVLDCS